MTDYIEIFQKEVRGHSSPVEAEEDRMRMHMLPALQLISARLETGAGLTASKNGVETQAHLEQFPRKLLGRMLEKFTS